MSRNPPKQPANRLRGRKARPRSWLPAGSRRTSAVLRGEPLPQLAAVIEANPDLKKLFVPVEELAETRCQLRKEGSGMQRLFKIINEASRKARKAKE